MLTSNVNLSLIRFGARLWAVVAFCALLLCYLTALWPHMSAGAQTQAEPVAAQAVAISASEKDVPMKKEGADVKEAAELDVAAALVGVSLPELVTATSYPFSSAAGVALEDMSSGTTNLVPAGSDDGNSALVNIGFDFWFDGVRFTQFGVNANGFARLGLAPTGTSFTNSIATTTNAPKIMPYWDDLWVGTNGQVHFKVVGTAPSRKLVIEWQNMTIPRQAAATTGAGTFQLWLYESTHATLPGVITFVYGNGIIVNSANGGYSVGLQSGAATNFASVTTSTNTVSYAAANNTQTNAITAGTAYTFTPPTPTNDPTSVNFTGTTAISTTVNWQDNSSNEVGFVLYRSTDGGVNYTFLTQTAANATSFTDNGLTPNTQYFYQVRAVTEGALSNASSGNVTTNAAGNISSTAAGGNWSATATWAGGVVPTASDNVTIVNGATVTIDTAAVAFSVTVGTGGTPTVLQYEATTARSLTVGTNVAVATNGTLQSAATGTVTTHTLSVGGNLTNNGVLDFSTNANTAGAGITFSGAANNTFGGAGATTDIRAITVNKGTSSASVVEVTTTNFTVQGVTTDVAGFLTLTNGTFKISGTFTVTNRVFTTAIYTISATGGIWLNNPNFVVAGTVSSTTTVNNGLFRVTQGTYNIGTGAGDEMGGGTGAVFIVEGGTVNASGRLDPQNAVSYTQTAGTVNVATVGNNRSLFGSFEIFNAASSFTMSGGTINVINRNTGATQVDYDVLANTVNTNVTGGLLVVGATGAPAATTYHVQGTTPNLTINPTMTMVVTINASSTFPLFMRGTTVTNNGTITSAATGSPRFDFGGNGPMTYTGGTFGTAAVPFAGVGISANSTSLTTLNSPIFCNRVNLFQGGFINSNQITLGTGGTSTTVVQIGSTGLTTPGGSFDVSPVHNQGTGTGGEILLYAFETTPRTTGVEINPTRNLLSISNVDNPNGVTIAGGDLTLNATAAALVLTSGRLITGSNTLILSSGTATVTRTNGYVDGNFRKNFAAAASKVFEVGTANAYSPVTVNATAGTFPADVTVRAVQGKQPNVNGTNALQRYWKLTAPAGVTADLTFQYLVGDVVGTEASYQVFKYTGTFTSPAGSSVDTVNHRGLAPGQSAITADWTLAEATATLPQGVNGGGTLIISELRFRGPTGANSTLDEFIEIYNNTNVPFTVNAPDGSAGFAIAAADGNVRCTITNGTVILPFGHFLCANSVGYSLAGYAAADATYAADIPDNGGVTLFATANTANFNSGTRIDSAGAVALANTLYKEGTGLPTISSDGQYSFVRKLNTGLPQDTGNNSPDFVFVSPTAGNFFFEPEGGIQSQRGAPGPENLTSPTQRNATIKAGVIDPSQPATVAPNRVRDTTPNNCGLGAACAQGTLDIRRKFTNMTGLPVTALRFRVVDITTTGTPGSGLADMRLLTSTDTTAGVITITGTTLQAPSDATSGGGLNSSVVVAIPGGTLANTASVNVRLLLGVAVGGNYRFFINVEAVTTPPSLAQPAGSRKTPVTK